MSDPVHLPQQHSDFDSHREARLLEIRKRAEQFGTVGEQAPSIPGAPFPIASPETGYYGIPLLKQPQWNPEIPVYFFVGGAAGSCAVIGAVCNAVGKNPELARDARLISAAGAVISSALLIADLGRSSRFLNMLRVFKPQSPMSMGAWTLAGFGTFSGAAATATILAERFGWGAFRILGNAAEGFSALFGLPFSNYTGVLIGATVIPVWNHNVKTLPFHFGMSGLNSGVSVLELAGHTDSPALNRLGILASSLETYEGYHLEIKRDPVVNRPVKHGTSGWITRVGGVLSGPIPLGLRIAAEFMPRKRKTLRRWAAISSITGSLLTRAGWVHAGSESAKDWRLPLLEKQEKRIIPMQSQEEYPRFREEKVDVGS